MQSFAITPKQVIQFGLNATKLGQPSAAPWIPVGTERVTVTNQLFDASVVGKKVQAGLKPGVTIIPPQGHQCVVSVDDVPIALVTVLPTNGTITTIEVASSASIS